MSDANKCLQFEFEYLEAREMLAGDVDVIVRGDDVVVRGDSGDNSIRVSLDANGYLVVAGENGTTVIGGETGIAANKLTIRMRGGDDAVTIESDPNLNISNELSVFGMGGDDRIELKTGVGGRTRIETGDGQNSVYTENFFPEGDVFIGSGCGMDDIDLTLIQATDVEFVVNTRGGADSVDILSSNFSSLQVNTAGGNDTVRIAAESIDGPRQVSIAGESSVELGAGKDSFETNIVVLLSFGHAAADDPNAAGDGPVPLNGSAGRTVESLISPQISTEPFLVFANRSASLTVSGDGGSDALRVNGESSSSASASDHVRAAIFGGFESLDGEA